MLLDDTEVKELFASLRHIASFLEHDDTKINSTFSSRKSFPLAAHLSALPSVSGGFDGGLKCAAGSELDAGRTEISANIDFLDVTTISDIGSLLHLFTNKLEKRVSACLIEFYEYMKKKEYQVLNSKSPRPQDESGRLQSMVSAKSITNSGRKEKYRNFEDGIEADPIHEGSGSPLKPLLREGWTHRDISLHKRATKGPSDLSFKISPCSSMPSTAKNDRERVCSSFRRSPEAASILQNHFYLLLESAVAETGASCGAIYLSDTSEMNTATHPEDGPRFLVRVADILAENRLPQSVSFATINTLTMVAQTGVAVNLSGSKADSVATPSLGKLISWDSEAAALKGLGSMDKKPIRTPASKSKKKVFGRFLRVKTAVVMPIDHIGCVIVANKREINVGAIEFVRADEFVVWSLANSCKQIFMRYKTDLWFQHPWVPSAMTCLRQFTMFPSVVRTPKDSQLSRVRKSSDRWRSIAHVFTECNKHLEGDRVPKPLVVMRTDVDTFEKLECDKIAKLRDIFPGICGSMNEEELFTSASEYISNIETLWTQTIKENIRLKSDYDRILQELEDYRLAQLAMKRRKQ